MMPQLAEPSEAEVERRRNLIQAALCVDARIGDEETSNA